MIMAMVGIRKMGMAVFQRLVMVNVAVPNGNFTLIEVVMMPIIMTVSMIVIQGRMKMNMAVALGYCQPHTRQHQRQRAPKIDRERFVQHQPG
mgnify:CR=1 FL=1